jgi:hypothetical protein
MRALIAGTLVLFAGAAGAEVQGEEFTAGDQLVQIEVFDAMEIMWVGPNQYERTQVLSGADIEIVAEFTDDEALQMLGARVLVVEVPGTHSCENLDDPREYYVVTLGSELATEGPVTTCAELTVSVTNGAIVLEENPMGEGESWAWSPGAGFSTGAN